MALLKLRRLNFKLDLEKVRAKMFDLIKDPVRGFEIRSDRDDIKAVLHPVTHKNPKFKYVVGTAWYRSHRNNRVETVPIFGTIRQWERDPEIQSISLNTLNSRFNGGKYLQPEDFRRVDAFLFRALKYLFAYAVDVNLADLEFIEPSTDSNGQSAEAINIGAWGKQSCYRFEWSVEAEDLRAHGAELHRYCSRCAHIDEKCPTAIQIAANRKKEKSVAVSEETPVAATTDDENPKLPFEGWIDPIAEHIVCKRDGELCTETCYCRDCKREVK